MAVVDYSYFDALLDSVLILNSDKGIVYCNETAATLLESSVKRLTRGKPIYEFVTFSNTDLFLMPEGKIGESEPVPMQEVQFQLKNGEKSGKVQITMQPFTDPNGEARWITIIRDVTIEEVLHAKHHEQLKQLEAYSRNLEQMVEERTQEVKRANVMLNAIMNSLGQGFLVFDREGVCSKFYTRACEDILETVPADKKIWEVLRLTDHDLETFQMWMKALYDEHLAFDSMKELGPQVYRHTQGRHVKLDYFPLRDEQNKISHIVVVATDWTSEFLAQQALENEKKYARMIIKLVTSKRQFKQFVESVPAIVDECKKIVMAPGQFDHETLFRVLHTLEGEAATYSAMSIWQQSRTSQELIEPLKRGESVDLEAIRPQLLESLAQLKKTYDEFLNENKELFELAGLSRSDAIEVDRGRVLQLIHFLRQRGVSAEVIVEVQDQLLREPVIGLLRHYEDVVQTVANKLGRQVAPLQIHGGDTRIFAEPYQELFSSLVHAFRNAVDHGIEPAEEREMAGKSLVGQLAVHCSMIEKEGRRWFQLVLQDDGKGIFVEELRKKLKSRYSEEELARKTDFEVIQHVFDSGVSTKSEIGEFSGRGIGMNAIKAEAEALGGRSWVETEPLQGTRLYVEVPDLAPSAELAKSA